ncbi:hypothetical protein C8J56DRAFT_1059083 [Mycena floridula]|nr:hypothetical protein C8J56DRAFT_1059083 [Mycena floridula]
MDAATMQSKQHFIEELIARRKKRGHREMHLLTFLTSDVKAKLSFEDVRHPASRRMLLEREDGPEEVNLFVTGFIESKKTAPFHNNSQALDPERASFQKQTVNLTGFGTRLFGQSIQRLHELITLFERSYPEHGVETWDLPTAIIQASNRYFTRASDIGSLQVLSLDRDTDPYGILGAASRGRYVYTNDNKVDCFQMVKEETDGTTEYEPMKIGQLREGDAVELSISLVGFPVRNSRNRVSVILRGVTLLNNRYSRIQHRQREQVPSFREVKLGKRRHQFPEEAYIQSFKDLEPEAVAVAPGDGDEEEGGPDEDEGQLQFEHADKRIRRRSVA